MKLFALFSFVTLLAVSSAVQFPGFGWLYYLRPALPHVPQVPQPEPQFPRGVCTISIQKDLGSPQPLLLLANKTGYYLPSNKYGDITFQSTDTINLSCPQGEVLLNGVNTKKSILPIRCQNQKVFEVIDTKQTSGLNKFTCNKSGHIARYTGKTCLGGFSEAEIGFQVEPSKFLRQMTICFDKNNQTTAYSAYNLTKQINGNQFNVPRPQFDDADFYNTGKHEVYNLYSAYVQRVNVNKQLGLPQNSKKYIGNGDYFLSRGHLTARADFVYANQQNSTFYYINAAPQWQTFNEGNWNELEKSVRKYAGDNLLDLIVYTGTHGVATLPHESTNVQTPLYLYNENGRRGIPVPRIYWKIVYKPSTKAAIAFVGMNNPYNNAISEDVLCKDICNQLTWKVSWNRTSITEGYGYCCEVSELKKHVKNIPDLQISGVLL